MDFFIGQNSRLDQHQKRLIDETGLTVLNLQTVVKSYSLSLVDFSIIFN